MKYTTNMGLRKPEGGEYYSIDDFNVNVDTLDAAVSAKTNKPFTFMPGNLAAVGVGGNLEDSGKKESDFATAEHSHNMVYAPTEHVNDITVHVSAIEKAAIAVVDDKANQSYVDLALANKANKNDQEVMATLKWYDAVLVNGVSGTVKYCKLNGVVHLYANVVANYDNPNSLQTGYQTLFVLPKGYRPLGYPNQGTLFFPVCSHSYADNGVIWALQINGATGAAYVAPHNFNSEVNAHTQCIFSVSFPAEC